MAVPGGVTGVGSGGLLAGMDLPYQVSSTEKVRSMEDEMQRELYELQNEIEKNKMVHGIQRPVSSVVLPKDITYFRRERELLIKRAMEVCEAKPVTIQSDLMREELDAAGRSDYTPEALTLLLHQYFVDRIGQLVQLKHMHMLRWKRFCEHTSTIESLFPHYHKRLTHIMCEYNDCIQRAQRLSIAREAYLTGTMTNAVSAIRQDDLMIYLRWLVSHLHAIKKFNQYLKVLQWLPMVHKSDLVAVKKETEETDDLGNPGHIPSRYNNDSFLAKLDSSRPPSSRSSHSVIGGKPPTPPAVNPLLLTTSPIPITQCAYTAAASGGGLASDENSLNIPVSSSDLTLLRPQLNFLAHLYGVTTVDVNQTSSSADEMELYATVTRKFKQLFTRQEHMKTFKTYDRLELGQENWGADCSMHAMRQEANWLEFIKLKPGKDARLERKMVELRSRDNVDELLRVMARFLSVTEPEKVQESLREHAMSVRDPLMARAVSVQSNKNGIHTSVIWKRIYTNPDLFNKNEEESDLTVQDFDEKDAETVDLNPRSRAASARKRKDSYDYKDTVQLLGLDEGDQDSNDPASVQGAFLSFLQLRHLRIRDLQRTCLSFLNYFRSVERTLTINDGGLSLESGKLKKSSPQDHRRNVVDSNCGGGGGLPSHQYIHNTPRDFKIAENEFMEFSDIENHDDFYTIDEGRIHVQDQRGYYIVYDAAQADLKQIEKDMLLIATHYIEKDRTLRNRGGSSYSAGDFDISSYGHQGVDRFGVLLDLWSNEAAFLECKKELLDCYLEAYYHISDRDEKRGLAQVITNVMYRRPRYDFEAPYFIRGYRQECICIRLEANLVKSILDQQIEEQREYVHQVCHEGDSDYGLPYKIIAKQPIAINMCRASVRLVRNLFRTNHMASFKMKEEQETPFAFLQTIFCLFSTDENPHPRSALKNIYMMEFHPSLSVASRIPEALQHAYWELHHSQKPANVTDMILLHRRLLETAQKEWDTMPVMGTSYNNSLQKDLYAESYVENPLSMTQIAQTLVHQLDESPTHLSPKERQLATVQSIGKILEVLTVRYRLMDLAWETEILAKVYRKQAVEMGYDECHYFLRNVQFEFAAFKQDAGKPPPILITAIKEDDSGIDRFIPNSICLAIHELDESNVGKFSFSSIEGILQVLQPGGMDSLQTVLMCQVVHKNALMAAAQQANACQWMREVPLPKSARPGTPTETKSEKSSMTDRTALSGVSQGIALTGQLHSAREQKETKAAEAFVSLQLEKTPSRDLMLNEFVSKKSKDMTRKKAEEMKLKRKLISDFCYRFNQRIAQYSLRSQIIAYYNSILGLLEDFPNIRDTYFMLGEPNEKKSDMDSIKGLEPDPRSLRSRPRRVMSHDGKQVLNVWFIPHYTELLLMFKEMDDLSCQRALQHALRIVSTMHDILQYLCAHARMGSSHARLGSKKMEFVSADWGGTEGIGAELREIQHQIDHLNMKTDPEKVCQFMQLRKDVMFLEFDAAVRHSMRDTFLATNNLEAFTAINNCMHFALHFLSNAQHPCLDAIYLNVPEPLEARDPLASQLYPWRTFLNRNGPYGVHFWQWSQIDGNLQLCLSGLKAVDCHVANGEILGVSLLLEDVLTMDRSLQKNGAEDEDPVAAAAEAAMMIWNMAGGRRSSTSTPGSTRPSTAQGGLSRTPSLMSLGGGRRERAQKRPLSKTEKPIEAYILMRNFLLLWKRLEVCKNNYGCTKLGVEKIESIPVYKSFCKEYRKDILYPVLSSTAWRYGQADMYEGMVSEDEPLVMPKGASEMEIKIRQLYRLLEMLECHMIMEVRKRFARELNVVLSERAREESALPTDLWKKPAMKESFTLNKPHIAEDFMEKLMSQSTESGEQISFSKEHLTQCLSLLASDVMARERDNFDSYSMYYENHLRVHHQLLYQREQEVKQVTSKLQELKASIQTQVQCELADSNQSLLLEVTALRAKIAEMRSTLMNQEQVVREDVRQEYDELVHNLFSVAYDLKRKYDVFREELYDSVDQKISEAQTWAIESMMALKKKSGAGKGEEDMKRSLAHADQIRNMQEKNHHLSVLMTKMKSMNNWKQARVQGISTKKNSELQRDAERSKKQYLEVKMMAEEEVILLRQQVLALRTALRAAESESADIKNQLDKELKSKKDKLHAAQQNAQSMKQLEDARKANIDKLLDELEDKDSKLRNLAEDQDRSRRVQHLMHDKIKKDVDTIRKQLNHERHLKLDAFQRVDELQSTIYDIESNVYPSRPQTVDHISVPTRPHTATAGRSRSRASSARRSYATSASGGVWPPPIPWPVNRSITPAPDFYGGTSNNKDSAAEHKKIQRPKTAGHMRYIEGSWEDHSIGRLRSRIADQLVNDLEVPDHHETLMRLQELRAMQQAEKPCVQVA